MLFDMTNRPDHHVRLGWNVGTLVIWDNRGTQHYVMADYAGHREQCTEPWCITTLANSPFLLTSVDRTKLADQIPLSRSASACNDDQLCGIDGHIVAT